MAGEVNLVSIKQKVAAALNKGEKRAEIRSRLRDGAEKGAERVTSLLISKFRKHHVTRELAKGGESPLISFLGLPGDKITQDVTSMLFLLGYSNVTITKVGDTVYNIKISFTEIDQFYRVTDPPSRTYNVSWLYGLENGAIANYEHFLFSPKRKFRTSRTGTGIQVEGRVNWTAKLPAIPYISEIYNETLKESRAEILDYIKAKIK